MTVTGTDAKIDVLKDGVNGPTAVTQAGKTAWVLEGKLNYMSDTKLGESGAVQGFPGRVEVEDPIAIIIIHCMASITIRNIDDSVKQRLRVRAAKHGRSMEEEARRILTVGVIPEDRPDLASAIRALFEPLGGVEILEYPRSRSGKRKPPVFG